MKLHKLRLAFTVVLEFEAETETPQDAFLAAQTYESLILSRDWQAKEEIAPIQHVKETLYYSTIQIADTQPAGLVKLG